MRINNRRLKHDIFTAYRRMTWKIWVYLKANPDVLAENNNQEVYDEVARIQTDMYLRRNPDQTREEAFSTQDFISDLEAKYNADDYYFEQELMDLFRPSVEHNQAWGAMLFLELRFFTRVCPRATQNQYAIWCLPRKRQSATWHKPIHNRWNVKLRISMSVN